MIAAPIPIPPIQLMNLVGSYAFGDFLLVGEAWANIIQQFVKAPADLLDIGCGCGRTARFLTSNALIRSYVGFDVSTNAIDWARENIGSCTKGRFRFLHCPVFNGFYNPGGTIRATEFKFPAADRSITLAFAASLFTHLLEPDARHYLQEVSRVLRPGGILVASIHDENAEPGKLTGAEERVDMTSDYFLGMAAAAGLELFQDFSVVVGQHLLALRLQPALADEETLQQFTSKSETVWRSSLYDKLCRLRLPRVFARRL